MLSSNQHTAHPNPNYTSAISFLKAQAHSLNLQTQTLHFTPKKQTHSPPHLTLLQVPNPSLPSLLFNSHVDFVLAKPSKWFHLPFSAVLSSNVHIYANGAWEDKSKTTQSHSLIWFKFESYLYQIRISCLRNSSSSGFSFSSSSAMQIWIRATPKTSPLVGLQSEFKVV